ncbi:Fur family transcriptional regulator [Desulfobulbus alkaliphilus]|uniref:Fur family transcriptional regulator n=1 Tax=Desulfobulbus alkaliphilus TaxID=869814 RepID=UPI001962DA07|nr:Fur family transcriptional regulator [Desulfobulbus alkaliphilus]MBM9536701.1 transcriptional repressor [Desulfobulbus alkaliphilus]
MNSDDFKNDLDHFEQTCKNAGLKVTQQRMEIYRALLESSDHPSAETLYRRLRDRMPTLSLDTVYRTLATFEKHRLVHRLETKESQARFEALNVRHHHFLCDRCGSVFDFTWPAFDTVALPPTLGRIGTIERKNVVLHGRCTACLAAEDR